MKVTKSAKRKTIDAPVLIEVTYTTKDTAYANLKRLIEKGYDYNKRADKMLYYLDFFKPEEELQQRQMACDNSNKKARKDEKKVEKEDVNLLSQVDWKKQSDEQLKQVKKQVKKEYNRRFGNIVIGGDEDGYANYNFRIDISQIGAEEEELNKVFTWLEKTFTISTGHRECKVIRDVPSKKVGKMFMDNLPDEDDEDYNYDFDDLSLEWNQLRSLEDMKKMFKKLEEEDCDEETTFENIKRVIVK
jgi:hypothetical protein